MNLYECLGVSRHRDASVSGEEWIQSPDGFPLVIREQVGAGWGGEQDLRGIIRSHY